MQAGAGSGVVITHDMRSAYTVGTRIAMLYEGRVRWEGTIEEIHETSDPIVRQFIEGRATVEGGHTDEFRTVRAGDPDDDEDDDAPRGSGAGRGAAA